MTQHTEMRTRHFHDSGLSKSQIAFLAIDCLPVNPSESFAGVYWSEAYPREPPSFQQ